MKLEDIEVGKDYAVGSKKWSLRGTVVAVGVHGRVVDSSGFHWYKSERADYVMVSYDHGLSARAEHCRSVLRPWAEQEVIDAERNARKAAPELLEACVEFVRKVESGEATARSYAQMKAAIAKATEEGASPAPERGGDDG